MGREIRAGTAEYASLADRVSRTSARARVLKLIDGLRLGASPVTVRTLEPDELQRDGSLRGAVVIHLDLASRSAITSTELLHTARSGRLLVAEHAELRGFPIGVALALPSVGLPVGRRALFAADAPSWGDADTINVYALATNPGGLGAGRALMEAARREAAERALVAYAPLTGLRARIIQLVEDPDTWTTATAHLTDVPRASLARQLGDLLVRTTAPDLLDEPAMSFLAAEARAFAAGGGSQVGRFHRHMGAELAGVDDVGDPSDCDAMWARGHFRYPPATQ